MDKGEMIAEFYSLRAGLSLIAQEKDKLDAKIDAAEKRKAAEMEKARFVADTKIEKSAERIRKAAMRQEECELQVKQQDEAIARASSVYYSLKDNLNKIRESASADNMKKAKAECKRRTIKTVFKILIFIFNIAIPIVAVLNSFLMNDNGYVYIGLTVMPLMMIIFTLILNRNYDGDDTPKIFIIGCDIGLIVLYAFLISAAFRIQIPAMQHALGCVGLITIPCFTIALKNEGVDFGRDLIIDCKRAAEKISEMEERVAIAKQEYDVVCQGTMQYDDALEQAENEFVIAEAMHDTVALSAESEYASTCAGINEQYETTCAAAKAVHSEIGSAIYDLLVKQYGKLLDARDWQIVDLVIWQLETGRADTLKEALQLADRETQTDRIVASINSAAMYISSSIRDGLYSLQTRLDDNFRALAYGFATGASLISERLDKLSASVAASARALSEQIYFNAQASADLYERQIDGLLAANSNIEQLVSQTTLNTALLEKSNQSSKTLVAAVEKLRRA